ncbi:MAG: PAS domain-containing protein [Nitrososphaerota archaeon]|nr:PAS domain-containing protein [Nitrososphaerota archaeon]
MARRTKGKVDSEWFEGLPCAITVCDRDYKILYMNEKAASSEKEGKASSGRTSWTATRPAPGARSRRSWRQGTPTPSPCSEGTPRRWSSRGTGRRKEEPEGSWRSTSTSQGCAKPREELNPETTKFISLTNSV